MITKEQFIKDFNSYSERRSAIIVKVVSSNHKSDKTEYNLAIKELEDINNELCYHGKLRTGKSDICYECDELCSKYFEE